MSYRVRKFQRALNGGQTGLDIGQQVNAFFETFNFITVVGVSVTWKEGRRRGDDLYFNLFYRSGGIAGDTATAGRNWAQTFATAADVNAFFVANPDFSPVKVVDVEPPSQNRNTHNYLVIYQSLRDEVRRGLPGSFPDYAPIADVAPGFVETFVSTTDASAPPIEAMNVGNIMWTAGIPAILYRSLISNPDGTLTKFAGVAPCCSSAEPFTPVVADLYPDCSCLENAPSIGPGEASTTSSTSTSTFTTTTLSTTSTWPGFSTSTTTTSTSTTTTTSTTTSTTTTTTTTTTSTTTTTTSTTTTTTTTTTTSTTSTTTTLPGGECYPGGYISVDATAEYSGPGTDYEVYFDPSFIGGSITFNESGARCGDPMFADACYFATLSVDGTWWDAFDAWFLSNAGRLPDPSISIYLETSIEMSTYTVVVLSDNGPTLTVDSLSGSTTISTDIFTIPYRDTNPVTIMIGTMGTAYLTGSTGSIVAIAEFEDLTLLYAPSWPVQHEDQLAIISAAQSAMLNAGPLPLTVELTIGNASGPGYETFGLDINTTPLPAAVPKVPLTVDSLDSSPGGPC